MAPLTPKTLEELIADLPAAARAEIHWAPNKLRRSLSRLVDQPLSKELIGQVTAEVLGIQAVVRLVVMALPHISPDEYWARIEKSLPQQLNSLKKLRGKDRRAAARAAATMVAVTKLGVAHLVANPSLLEEFENLLDEQWPDISDHEALAGLRSTVVLLALLHLLETAGYTLPRASELAQVADDEASVFAEQLANTPEPGFRALLPWYIKPSQGAEAFEMYASWSEDRLRANDSAVELLKRWQADQAVEEQRSTWSDLQVALDEDRLSSRKLFP